MEINESVRYALTEYQGYTPRTWDNGKDAEEYEEFREHLPEMIKHAVDGLHKYFEGVNRIEGESMKQFIDELLKIIRIILSDPEELWIPIQVALLYFINWIFLQKK